MNTELENTTTPVAGDRSPELVTGSGEAAPANPPRRLRRWSVAELIARAVVPAGGVDVAHRRL